MPITDRNHFSHASIEEADRKNIIQACVVVAAGFLRVFILYGTYPNASIIAGFISQGLTGASNIMFILHCDTPQNRLANINAQHHLPIFFSLWKGYSALKVGQWELMK